MVVGTDEVAEVARWAEGIERVHQCIAGRFRRPEPRRRAMEYLKGLLSPVERKNGWQLAVLSCRREAGDATPYVVQRQYSGTAGRIENSQVGVFLAYASAKGGVLLDRELYLPQVWAEDRERRREAGVPEDTVFRTKGQLARQMLQRAVESELPFA